MSLILTAGAAAQIILESKDLSATIIPVIILSDKTQVTLFHNKSTYPIYLTISNIPKSTRRQTSQHGYILLGYLPTTKLKHVMNKTALGAGFNTIAYSILKVLWKYTK